MHSPPPDAPIPLVPVDNVHSYPPGPRESPLKREEDVDEEQGAIRGEENEGVDGDPPKYPPPPPPPPSLPRVKEGRRRRVRHTRTGSTRAVPGFGTRSRASVRHALYLLLERPTSSHSAFVLHLVTNVVIVLRSVPSSQSYLAYRADHFPFFLPHDAQLPYMIQPRRIEHGFAQYPSELPAPSSQSSKPSPSSTP
jgi:hypothetical protein